jgi:hypothetical protein
MEDARFTMVGGDLDRLLGVMDIDDVSDIETLLIILFKRPISVEPLEGFDDDDGSLEVTVWVGDTGHAAGRAFPMTVVDLVRACASVVAELDPADGDYVDPADGQASVLTMGDDYLVVALQHLLGNVRRFNILDADQWEVARLHINHRKEPGNGEYDLSV